MDDAAPALPPGTPLVFVDRSGRPNAEKPAIRRETGGASRAVTRNLERAVADLRTARREREPAGTPGVDLRL